MEKNIRSFIVKTSDGTSCRIEYDDVTIETCGPTMKAQFYLNGELVWEVDDFPLQIDSESEQA